MGRRRKTSPAEDFIAIASKLPWWLALGLAVISYFLLHAFASQPLTAAPAPGQMTSFLMPVLLKGLATAGQYILPLLFGVAALLSGVQQRKRSSSPQPLSGFSAEPHQANAGISPHCPVCSSSMVRRDAKRGANAGKSFWGCSQYPRCKGTQAAG
ncbi:topoisomerase DNA-binding C4 zinc finger domain-containing protein [Polaromonas naphthalenivorans]|uniref:DNA topoisomerase, type IA, zn finger domain protein n=1 Tax=Polaromonas naphthalenivorans (strain CJ2) TaxID=365044 RepID=A1VWJ5_POLNA|nr:topoisomerase DNA-binding C4 zinc finger domain-containing protein [Polaromonas naphthalenivorans]ABM40023.1 DNA topoisomerase, type IA, zn finger domain protein [Polaromonas naphthalenivorans CJ2]